MSSKPNKTVEEAFKTALLLYAKNHPGTKLSQSARDLIHEAIEDLTSDLSDTDFLASYALNRVRRRR